MTVDLSILLPIAALVDTPSDLGEVMAGFIVQLAVVIIAARLGGLFFRRYLRLPRVIGELAAGMVIGPYALGGMTLFQMGPLFVLPNGPIPVSTELYAIATFASILLLFLAGLQTDLTTFLRYSVAGTIIGLAGAICSFALGAYCAVWFGVAASVMEPAALFLGAIATATSVGITVRVLAEKNQMSSPEGVTIMAAAVLDDVIGIVLTAVVVGVGRLGPGESSVQWHQVAWIATKAFGFWILCTTVFLLLARRISHLLKMTHELSTVTALALGLALLLAGLAGMAGLAMIIGAYIMGLALSRTDLALFLQEQLRPLHEITVPVFFCVIGMLVDWRAMQGVLGLGFAYSLCAALSKLIGCGAPAMFMKFNWRGALRIGLGMLPRAEVALVVAGVGLTSGSIAPPLFGVAVMMIMLNTLVAPTMLNWALDGPAGVRARTGEREREDIRTLTLQFPSAVTAEFVLGRVTRAFRREMFFVNRLHTDRPTYQMRGGDMIFTLEQRGPALVLRIASGHEVVARLIIAEELLSLQDLFEACKKMESVRDMEVELLHGLFDGTDKMSNQEKAEE